MTGYQFTQNRMLFSPAFAYCIAYLQCSSSLLWYSVMKINIRPWYNFDDELVPTLRFIFIFLSGISMYQCLSPFLPPIPFYCMVRHPYICYQIRKINCGFHRRKIKKPGIRILCSSHTKNVTEKDFAIQWIKLA